MNWLTSASHRRWLASETERLVEFATASVHPDGGFGWLDSAGVIDPTQDRELWITCRMTHVFALASLAGIPGASALVDHGVAALQEVFLDAKHGGWYAAVGAKGPTVTTKEAYGHAFVVLAASSAVAAGRPGAQDLLTEALEVHTEHFWDERAGMAAESFDADWSNEEPYRGVNANMHTVEAYLAASDVLSEHELARRALRVTTRVVSVYAQGNGWRIPEHYDAEWMVDLDYHQDTPAHPFRPYGATVGHAFEWARLTAQLAHTLQRIGMAAPEWMYPAAQSLYATAVADGWHADGADGFVYTTDWEGAPVVSERMHWVAAEAISAAAVLWNVTKSRTYADDYRRWWDFVGTHHRDGAQGSWFHELSPSLEPSSTVWTGKPDVYHAVQATLLPRVPISPALAAALVTGQDL